MIIVTGGAGFIGSNLVARLCEDGHQDVVVVDDLTDGHKFKNLADCNLMDYVDSESFLAKIQNNQWPDKPQVIFHQGACSDTTEWDGAFMMRNNFEYSKQLLHYCLANDVALIYASSASVYGANTKFSEDSNNESPLNVYAYSKVLFDRYVQKHIKPDSPQVVGLRYFNVYGPRETHKGKMASIAWQLYLQACEHGVVKLFEGSDGYADGEQRRDFVYVDDVVDVNVWFWRNAGPSGIYNCGTGASQTFNAVARAVVSACGRGSIEYQAFPEHLSGHYQSFTEADISRLRSAGYTREFLTVEQGVARYLGTNRAP